MNHLGDRLAALVDEELSNGDRDKALAHLAGCAHCRAEADAMRRVKRRLRTMHDDAPALGLVERLATMAEPDGTTADDPADTAAGTTDHRRVGDRAHRRVPRPRYFIVGATALVVLGVGAASFAAGAVPRSVPRVAPAVERFAVQHALTTGDVPLVDPVPGGDRYP